jgi:hypothetical protein
LVFSATIKTISVINFTENAFQTHLKDIFAIF